MKSVPFLLLAVSLVPGSAATTLAPPAKLRCEYQTNPLGIDTTEPRLSWQLASIDKAARGISQSAYRILVASSEQKLRQNSGDLWDSGRISTNQSVHVPYRGKALLSGTQAFWKIQAWDQQGEPSPWSEIATWSMGMLAPSDWKAKWIGLDETGVLKRPNSPYHDLKNAHWIWFPETDPSPGGERQFRSTFQLPKGRTLRRALAIIGVDSGFELSLNGRQVGRDSYVRMPATIDITQAIAAGQNTLAVKANATKGKPAGLICVVRLEFEKGNPELLLSGSNWQASKTKENWVAAKELGVYGMQPWGEVGFAEERFLPARMLRKEFQAPAKVRRATAYVSGLGLYELYVNGARIGDHVLAPGLTEYEKHVLYETHDVTRQLAAGKNAIGVILGNGRYFGPRLVIPIATRTFGYPKLLLQLAIEYENGTKETVISDESWRLSTAGPVRGNNEFDGEEYDARMEMKGWSRPGFADASWMPAHVVKAPGGEVASQMAAPIRVTETIHPVKKTQLRPGVYIFDMGQNMVGWTRLHVSGSKGTQVNLRHAETLRPDGTLYVDNLRSARATDTYTLKGEGAEVWEPRFTYHGFRFVEVSGYPGEPPLTALDGRVVHDDMEKTADFVSSNALVNQIHHNIYWGVRGNYRSIPTDCPQRDERQGWMGDRSQVSHGETYLFDVAAFYSKWMRDIADAQKPSGSISDVSPAYWQLYNDNVTWPSTFVLVPGMLYEQYGDLRVIENNYPAMKKWMDYMRGFMKGDLMPKDTYGDWCVPPESPELIHSKDPTRQTDKVLLATAYYQHLCRRMSKYAALLGKADDAANWQQLANRLQNGFERQFYNPEKGYYSNGTQTSSVLPLALGITPEEHRGTVLARLVDKIQNESNGHVGTGLVGAQWLMRALADNGQPDVAYTIATQKTYPGWGYMIQKGATTIWELWNGDTADPAMNSGNHVMQIGDLNIWLYEYLAGIRSDPDKPGFQHTIIRPVPSGDLTFVKASHTTMYGGIRTSWRRDARSITLDISVPVNTSATVYVPAKNVNSVTESGRPAAQARGVHFSRTQKGFAVYEIGSGNYSFRSN